MPQAGRASVGLDELLGRGGVADALDAVVERGLARFRWITAVGDAFVCRRAVESGRFDTAQVYYNLLNPSAGRSVPGGWTGCDMDRLIHACKRADVGVLCIRVLAAGVIATDERHGRESPLVPNAEVEVDARRAAAVFERLGSSFGTRAQTAIRYVLSNPDVSCAVVGIAELVNGGPQPAAPCGAPARGVQRRNGVPARRALCAAPAESTRDGSGAFVSGPIVLSKSGERGAGSGERGAGSGERAWRVGERQWRVASG
jgi:hypothetical protein